MNRIVFSAIFILSIVACRNEEKKDAGDSGKKVADSLARVGYKRRADSMRLINPLLIIPPDSLYTGDFVDKYPNGIIKFKGFFRQGQRHGSWIAFYPSGVMWSQAEYDKGIRTGQNTVYFQSGKVRYEGIYKNDMQDSVWTYYDTSGVMMERVLYSKNQIVKRMPEKKK